MERCVAAKPLATNLPTAVEAFLQDNARLCAMANVATALKPYFHPTRLRLRYGYEDTSVKFQYPPRDYLTALLSAALLTGCQPAMSDSSGITPYIPPKHSKYDNTVADWPFRFSEHSFGAHCFDTMSCRVIYKHFDHGNEKPTPSIASYRRSLDDLLSAGFIGIRNFPPPAQVTWQSKDGTPLKAEIDIAAIFKDELILHQVPKAEVSEVGSVGPPEIILVVEDRTIRVYMRALVSTKEAQIPGNQYSYGRNDLMLAFSHTY